MKFVIIQYLLSLSLVPLRRSSDPYLIVHFLRDQLLLPQHHKQSKQQHNKAVSKITEHQRKQKRKRYHCKGS